MTPGHTPPSPDRLLAQLRRHRQDSLDWQLGVIEASWPELYHDAQHFVEQTHALPWEFAVALVDGEPQALRDKYRVPIGRHRPAAGTVPPETDLFCEVCMLIEQRLFPDAASELPSLPPS